jgi:DNA-binding response OmpR family regulator
MAKVLVVDDERLTTDLLGAYLKMRGFEVVSTQHGRDVLPLALSEHPDIVLLDVMMPDIPGDMVCRMLRENPQTSALPVVMLSALYSLDSQEKARQAGADHYLPKNIPLPELVNQLNRFVNIPHESKQD